MIRLRIRLTSVAFFSIFLATAGQAFEIPEGRYELYWEKSFLNNSRKASSELPFKIKVPENNCFINMKYGNLFAHDAVPCILDGDTTLLSYIEVKHDEDSGEMLSERYTWFEFITVGMFEYKDYWVIVYSYPLADPIYIKAIPSILTRKMANE